ncbi:asparagine synthase (glutamine-hydrolyzing) [Alcanivorax sp. NBRC 102024]|uniref:asparagine synthase (glutamine-hydrolyzing) n=1 Tax=Alcanivorax sp. NBRC 102024 TaxID=1113895 RepID=UPI000789C2DE|nr:asparagine synthase (glutamine-hydrolyzing) [Alcanivorax sp. NBRC 102024]
MCGIVGLINPPAAVGGRELASTVQSMAETIISRGPDSQGVWVDDEAGLALGHRRLSIVDLTEAGHQPMVSPCGRYVLVFNGEIYNHLALRSVIEARVESPASWRGHSDTETLLVSFAVQGVEATLSAASGMFALALWDRHEQCLTLARDRFGEKPLYYGWVAGGFVFASELKALHAVPGWQGELDNSVVENYLRYGCVGGCRSIFRDVFTLSPGARLTLSRSELASGVRPVPSIWWSSTDVASEMLDARETQPATSEEVESVLQGAVGRMMEADVPLGAFLSGGVDSSLIVALMQKQAARPVKTFSVGFDDPRYDESSHAAAVAAHLGTEHTTLRATAGMALDFVPRLPKLYDEPFADSSQLPTCLIASLTREHVTVALSGDGGDEMFGGYNRHLWGPRVWSKVSGLPFVVRHALGGLIRTVSSGGYDKLMQAASRVMPSRFQVRTFGEKLYKLADVLSCDSFSALYTDLASMNRHPGEFLNVNSTQTRPEAIDLTAFAGFSQAEWMMLMDTLTYMVDDVLVKVDRASMASSLEVRAPFLDPEVFKTAWRLPVTQRVAEGEGKRVLRDILYRHVPRALIERPKMGFAVPLDEWLRGPLREWAESLLSPQALSQLPMLDSKAVQRCWQAHLQGKGHHAQQLWAVLQLVAWAGHWRPRVSA